MLRQSLLVVMLVISLLLFAACGPQSEPPAVDSADVSASPVDEPAAELEEEPVQEIDQQTEENAVDEEQNATEETVSTEGVVQQLNWGLDEENCLIPGLVITGVVTDQDPCSSVSAGQSSTAAAPEEAEVDESAMGDTATEESAAGEASSDKEESDGASEEEALGQPTLDQQATEVTALAVEDLSQQLGVPMSDIGVCDVCSVTWPDTSLGCPEPDMMYSQMVQEGHLIRLSADGESFYYHSGGMQPPFQCEETLQQLPPGVQIGE